MGNAPSGTDAVFSDPNYNDFLGKVKESHCEVNSPQKSFWRYFIYGNEKSSHPVVFLPSTTCVPEAFYRQFLDLPGRGYRLVAVNYPAFDTIEEFGRAFAAFLDYEAISCVHLVGCGIGGLLSQVFTAMYPKRVLSLFLCNSYTDNELFNMHPTQYYYQPLLVLKDNLLANLPSGRIETEIANSVIFVSQHFDQLTRDQVISRIGFTANHIAVKKPPIPDSHVTFLNVADSDCVPEELQKKTKEIYPGAHEVILKTGGDFPFFSRYEEFNLHLTVHLRRNADWGGISNTVTGGEPSFVAQAPVKLSKEQSLGNKATSSSSSTTSQKSGFDLTGDDNDNL